MIIFFEIPVNKSYTGKAVYTLMPGQTDFTIKVDDTANKGLLCHSICDQYNPSSQSTWVFPSIELDLLHHDETATGKEYQCLKRDFGDVYTSPWAKVGRYSEDRVRCMAYHTKAGHIGLGSYGMQKRDWVAVKNPRGTTTSPTTRYFDGIPEEPFDAQLPECGVKNHYTARGKVPPKALNECRKMLDSDVSNCYGMAMDVTGISSFKNFHSIN